jgi:Uncharacterised protein family UPF0547/FHA domain
MSTERNDISFMRCPSCKSLVPTASKKCRMCGFVFETNDDNQTDEASLTSGRVRQRTVSRSREEILAALEKNSEDQEGNEFDSEQDERIAEPVVEEKIHTSYEVNEPVAAGVKLDLEQEEEIIAEIASLEDNLQTENEEEDEYEETTLADENSEDDYEKDDDFESDDNYESEDSYEEEDSIEPLPSTQNQLRSNDHTVIDDIGDKTADLINEEETNFSATDIPLKESTVDEQDLEENGDNPNIEEEVENETPSTKELGTELPISLNDSNNASLNYEAEPEQGKLDEDDDPEHDTVHKDESLELKTHSDLNVATDNLKSVYKNPTSTDTKPKGSEGDVEEISLPISQSPIVEEILPVSTKPAESLVTPDIFNPKSSLKEGAEFKMDSNSLQMLVGWFVSFEDPKRKSIEIRGNKFFITRTQIRPGDLVVDNESVSSPHALVKVVDGGKVYLQDLLSEHGSAFKDPNSTEYNPVTDGVTISSGSFIKLGNSEFLLVMIPPLPK